VNAKPTTIKTMVAIRSSRTLDSCPKKKNPTIEAHLAHIIGSLLASFFMSKKPKVHKNQITSPIVIAKP
jgi:hypothetical protein